MESPNQGRLELGDKTKVYRSAFREYGVIGLDREVLGKDVHLGQGECVTDYKVLVECCNLLEKVGLYTLFGSSLGPDGRQLKNELCIAVGGNDKPIIVPKELRERYG